MDGIPGFLLAALALAGSPGPNTLSLAATGAGFGWRHGLGLMTGLNCGMALVIALSGSGVSAALLALPAVAPLIIGAAVLYFLWLAWRIATAPPLGAVPDAAPVPAFRAGVMISLLNPKAYAAMSAMFASPVLGTLSPLGAGLAKAGVLWAVIWCVNILWLCVGAALTPLFRDPRASRIVNIAFALLLLISVGLPFLG